MSDTGELLPLCSKVPLHGPDATAPALTGTSARRTGATPAALVLSIWNSIDRKTVMPAPRRGTGIWCRRSGTTDGDIKRRRAANHRRARAHDQFDFTATRRGADRPAAHAAAASLPRHRYFFSGSGVPGCLNGNVLNIDFA
ncbi:MULTISPECIES: hypothetical protein [unclassified Burkholderia]|uniref:hypothetical protein n=1 Tax=unclassified Burkholderia TaxID=2613784 RepID=UPI000F55AAE9|nr:MULTISPECIES: hypothetical protein [unclassified Burkholderia]